MKVWRGHRNVAQARHFEDVEVSLVFGDIEPAPVELLASGGLPVLHVHPEFPEHPAADTHTVMARGAPDVDECSQTRTGSWRQGRDVPVQVRIERRGRHEGALVCTDR